MDNYPGVYCWNCIGCYNQNKRQQEDERTMKESMASIDNFVEDAMGKGKAE